MNNTIVITGVNGFVGGHLAEKFHKKGFKIIGVGIDDEPTDSVREILQHYYKADLTKTWPVTEKGVRAIVHLAGLAAVGPSYDNPQLYIEKNSAMVTHMCEYYANIEKKPRILLISSGAIYDPLQNMPISEDSPLGYSSPYAVSKVLNENQAKYYRGRGLDCVVVRPFNHIGHGQGQGFILPDLYARIAAAQKNSAKEIVVGNLNTKRDYTDVRDIVSAYSLLALAETLKHDTYNICSGKSLSGNEILKYIKENSSAEDIATVVDETLIRPNDILDIWGDSSRIREELAWSPEHSIEETIRDYINNLR